MIKMDFDKPLKVESAGGEFGHITVPISRLDEVTAVLDRHPIRYYVHEGSMSINGSLPYTWVQLRRGADFVFVQSVLDAEIDHKDA